MKRVVLFAVVVLALSTFATTVQVAQSSTDAAAIEAWLRIYDAAFNAKDLDKLATFYHPDVTIFEGGGVNNGWIDYRDRHLGPELKSFENLQFGHTNTRVTMLPGGTDCLRHVRVFDQGQDGRTSARFNRARDARPGEGCGRQLEDPALAHVQPARAPATRIATPCSTSFDSCSMPKGQP